jgi:aminoglycoside 6'-N-acetyltransferase
MRDDDLHLVERWLATPHVARWFLAGSSLEEEIGDVRDGVHGRHPMHQLVVVHEDSAIGWCQWYLCEIDRAWAADMGAGPGDVGIDYAIGELAAVGRGLGTQLVGALVRVVRARHPGCGIWSDPDERNGPSRRVLEKNGFDLVAVRSLPSEPTDDPVAIYRLAKPANLDVAAPPAGGGTARADGVDDGAATESKREDT